jgi:putative radical SAM enzyme (TIGR03279 family)
MSLVPMVDTRAERVGHPGTVLAVAQNSLAAGAGLRVGDIVLSINGHPLRDPIDYRFYVSDDRLSLQIQRDGAVNAVRLRKHPDDDLGIVLPELTLEDIDECNNHCPFCFVTQLPRGMRATLHIKDDDYRFSFLNSSFVTLTNLSDDDWSRIDEQRLSPLYISVHSTNPDMRRKLLGNRHAPDVREQLDRLASLGIVVHTQIVLCPGINDGEDLISSVEDLLARYPNVRSVAIVPVGLTKIRTERTASSKNPLRRFRPDEAGRVVTAVQPYQRRNKAQFGEPIVYLSDEFYLLSGRRVPGRAHYTDLSQLENGVGMVRVLVDGWHRVQRGLPAALPAPRHLTLACGQLIAPVLAGIARRLNQVENLKVDIVPIDNKLFGAEVTVSGLITGRDLVERLEKEPLGDTVVVPRVMFDRAGEVTLDDMSVEMLESRLGRPVRMAQDMRDIERLVA